MTKKRMETVSEAANRILITEPWADARDLVHQQAKINFPREMEKAIERGIKEYTGDFYVFVITPKLRNPNAIKTKYQIRNFCPPPAYNQMVYKFDRNEMQPKVLWVIPSKDFCEWLYMHKDSAPAKLDPIKKYVVEFVNGTLDKLYYSLESKEKRDDG